MEITVEPSRTYAVTTSGSCTVTDADGLELCTASSGSQAFFVATTPTVTISDDGAKISRTTFNAALALLGQPSGGDKLPAGYTRLDFLQSTGAQYIDTGIVPSASHGLKIDHELMNDNDTIPFGCRNNGSSDTRLYALRAPRMSTNGSYLGYGWGTWQALSPNAEGRRVSSSLNWLNSGVAAWQGTTQKLPKLPFTPTHSLFMFAANVSGTPSLLCSCRVWSTAISKGDSVVANFIPAIDPMGRPCMYDTISKQAYPNKGSGRFIAGVSGVGALANILLALPHRETEGSILDVRLPDGVNQEEADRICELAGTVKNWQIVLK